MYGHTCSKSIWINRVKLPILYVRGQLNRENEYFPVHVRTYTSVNTHNTYYIHDRWGYKRVSILRRNGAEKKYKDRGWMACR